ncbi:MAG: chemotaxis protein CheX [Planctomycetota bacterium]
MQDPQHTQAFIQAVESIFADMFRMPLSLTDPRAKGKEEPWLDITGTINLTGSLSGTMALTFERATAEGVVSEMVGRPMDFETEETADAIGEIANIVAGMAKAKINIDGSLSITCPTITRGACVTRLQSESDAVAIDLNCPVGPLRLELSLVPTDAGADTQTAAA